MHLSTASVCIAFLSIIALTASATEPDYQAGYAFDRIQRIKYDEGSPFRPEYDFGRIFSTRHLAKTGATFNKVSQVNLILGTASVEVHSGEGETIQYDDSFIYGIEADYLFRELPWKNFSIRILGNYITSSFQDSSTSAVARDGKSVGSSSTLDWTEITISTALRYEFEKTRLLAGIEYAYMDIEQDRSFDDGSPGTSSTLDPEKDFGIITGIEYDLSDEWHAGFSASMFHQISFQASLFYSF